VAVSCQVAPDHIGDGGVIVDDQDPGVFGY